MTHWRNRMGAERLQALLQESLAMATSSEAIKPADFARAIVDITVPPKNVTFPTLLSLARRVRDQERGQRGPKVCSLHASRPCRAVPSSPSSFRPQFGRDQNFGLCERVHARRPKGDAGWKGRKLARICLKPRFNSGELR
jgi:hypothetical protein